MEKNHYIAQANVEMDKKGKFKEEFVKMNHVNIFPTTILEMKKFV